MSAQKLTTDEAAGVGALVGLFLIPGMIVIAIATGGLRAWVLTRLWAWFVLPVFPAAPRLTWVGAFGLLWTFGLFFVHIEQRAIPKSERRDFWDQVFEGVFVSLLSLGLGWLFHIAFRV
ncbi:MAG: hypothetical protein ABI665_28440 [Vicinamibacterales bacterium]